MIAVLIAQKFARTREARQRIARIVEAIGVAGKLAAAAEARRKEALGVLGQGARPWALLGPRNHPADSQQ
jgi:hypothetical protein